MIRMTTRLTSVACAALGALTALAGCSGTPPGEFIIIQNQVPGADCSIPATLGAIYRGEGFLDVGAGTSYQLFPLLQDDFPGPSGTLVEANRIWLSGFDVDIGLSPIDTGGAISDLITSLRAAHSTAVQYSSITSGSVASGGGNTASSVTVFPSDLSNMIHTMKLLPTPTDRYWLLASVRARGHTLVSDVRSDAFKYPIELCDGCLALNQGQCSASTPPSGACNPGQDGAPINCCDLSGQLVCR